MVELVAIEREIEQSFERACEKEGWVASAAISPERLLSLFLEKFSEAPIQLLDETAALERLLAFTKDEFGIEVDSGSEQLSRSSEVIPNTRAPYYVTYIARIDIAKKLEGKIL